MGHLRPTPNLSVPGAVEAGRAHRGSAQSAWLRLSIWAGFPAAQAVLATLAVCGMLLAFHQVMDGAVRQADARRQADALLAQASLRCAGQQGLKVRAAQCARSLP
jgi:hypothetical protein